MDWGDDSMIPNPATGDSSPRDATRWLPVALVVLLAAISAGLVLAVTPEGVATSPDAHNYIAGARNLLAGEGFYRADGVVITMRPPLYSLLLAGLYSLGDALGADLHVLRALRWVNALTIAATVLVAYRVIAYDVSSRALALAGTGWVALAYPLVYVNAYAWSEPLFILPGVLAVDRLARLLDRPAPPALPPLGLALIVALACLQRYAGVVVLGVVGASILLVPVTWPLRRRVWQAGMFGVLAMLPLGLFLARNYYHTDTLTGERIPATRALRTHLSDTWEVMSRWFVPESLGLGYLKGGAILVALLAVLVALYAWRYRRWRWADFVAVVPLPLLLLVIVYPAFFVITQTMTELTPIDDRYLAPVFPFLVALVFRGLAGLAEWLRTRGGRPMLVLAVTALALAWLVVPVLRLRDDLPTVRDIAGASAETYNTWRASALVGHLQDDPLNGRVYTNAPLHLLVHTGIAQRPVPAALADWSAPSEMLAGREPTYLVWFDLSLKDAYCDYFRQYCIETTYTPGDLREQYALEPVHEAGDGTVYRLQYLP